MKILEKVDWNVLNQYIEDKQIIANKHPEYDIWILNYSSKTQADKLWNIYTLSCRGMVVDSVGNILARPFQKFKNYEEHDPSEIDMSQDFDIFEKMDGSLIISFYYEVKGEWIVATRGSFISEQSIVAREMLRNMDVIGILKIECTYLFEVLYQENRIVVDYGNRRELVLLSRVNNETGFELNYDDLINNYSKLFTVVKKYNIENIKDLSQLKALEEENKEGFVIRFADGFRVKVKFSEYIRLHRILTNVSNLTIWEHLMNDNDFNELLDKVPDEFYDKIKLLINDLNNNFNEIEKNTFIEYISIINDLISNNIYPNKKEFALKAVNSENSSILFKIYYNENYDNIIWKKIKPKYSKI